MDKNIIDIFWKKRSAEGKGRWTDENLLGYELSWISEHAPPNAQILDLGSGPGELSCSLLPTNGKLTLVDKYPDFLKLAPIAPNIRKLCCDVLEFDDTERYDLILIFGVVTHLTEKEETQTYQKAVKLLSRNGTLIVKNQVSSGEEKTVSGYSPSLKQDYCGRYPGLEQQGQRLNRVFSDVKIIHYPEQFNPWPDTRHVAFVCKN
ncbi:class I SAM-dependent methyltransferase [Ferribacterium limneticum]|uniref:class I SAM-dependent methyltransferase n=1 Tax=Ferribacterium limneticum TaxID=76259 RepID=UPI001CF96DB0|nr:class I SAM-dependent methyltransferase [Ferribacterium limneticum]UCV29292.1 class I SAM-dependent methyltransferase [Ferribacterium limneticum]UCV33211.1 class I SAM-dependent methyltransferase [Ferribacterium limneticum]